MLGVASEVQRDPLLTLGTREDTGSGGKEEAEVAMPSCVARKISIVRMSTLIIDNNGNNYSKCNRK